MSTNQIRYPSQYTPQDIQSLFYAEPEKNQFGGYGAYIRPDENVKWSRMKFQTTKRKSEDKCISLFGVSMPYEWDGLESSISNRLSLNLEIKDSALLEFLKALDENNVRQATENHATWFVRNKKITKELVSAMYNPIVQDWESDKPDAQGNFKSGTSFRVKINRGGDRRTEIWVAKTDPVSGEQICEPGNYKDIVKGSRVVATVSVSSLYFQSASWGAVMNCSALIVFPPEQRNSGPDFVDDPDDDIPLVADTPKASEPEVPVSDAPDGWPTEGSPLNGANKEEDESQFADG